MSGKVDVKEVQIIGSDKDQNCRHEPAFLAIHKLLYTYSTLGIIPVKISKKCDSFKTQTWRYLLGPGTALAMAISISIFAALKYGSKGFYAVASERGNFSSLGKFISSIMPSLINGCSSQIMQ